MIRYDSAYNQEISRVVSNFNRKLRRLEKEGRRLLPNKVSISQIKGEFSNRRELNKYLNDLRKFSKRGAETIKTVGGNEYTNYEIDLFRTNLRRQREELRRNLEKAEHTVHRYPMQHDIHTQNIRNKIETFGSDWRNLIGKKYEQVVSRRMRLMETYDNYLEILFQDAIQIGFDVEKVNYMKEKLMELSPEKFDKVLSETPEIQFIFNYYHSLTRQSGKPGDERDWKAFEQLYERMDEIVAEYE